MLPRLYRLPSSQFSTVKSRGQLLQSPLFGLLVFRTPRSPSGLSLRVDDLGEVGPRFGFIVSTKISLKAVVRNRIRRLLSEALLPLLPRLQPNHDFIVLATTRLIDQPLAVISQAFHEILTPYLH